MFAFTNLHDETYFFFFTAGLNTFIRACRQRASSGRSAGRPAGRPRAARVSSAAPKKNHLIEAAPFGRLDQMLSTIV